MRQKNNKLTIISHLESGRLFQQGVYCSRVGRDEHVIDVELTGCHFICTSWGSEVVASHLRWRLGDEIHENFNL